MGACRGRGSRSSRRCRARRASRIAKCAFPRRKVRTPASKWSFEFERDLRTAIPPLLPRHSLGCMGHECARRASQSALCRAAKCALRRQNCPSNSNAIAKRKPPPLPGHFAEPHRRERARRMGGRSCSSRAPHGARCSAPCAPQTAISSARACGRWAPGRAREALPAFPSAVPDHAGRGTPSPAY